MIGGFIVSEVREEKIDEIAFDLSPVGKHDFVTQKQAVAILKKKGTPNF